MPLKINILFKSLTNSKIFKTIAYCFLLLFLLFIPFSCEDDIDLTPTYIEIKEFTLKTQSDEGTESHSITDAWIYINDNAQGVYELPAKFPLLAEGSHKLTLRAGIKSNGISATRIYYPFFAPLQYNYEFVRDSVYVIKPTVTYHPNVVFKWLEDFEDGGISLERSSKSEADIIKTSAPDKVYEGNYAAKAVLDSNKTFFECQTIDAYQLPKAGAPVFLELNYKNNAEVHVGIYAYTPGQVVQRSVLVLNPTEQWRKIYVNLTNAVSENINATEYRIFFGMIRDEDDSEIRKAFFDNIKLLHF